jgi:universal stress protein A
MMALYNKILLAVDFTAHTEQLCAHAVELAKLHGATLSIIHVVEPIVTDSAFDTLPPLPVDFDDVMVQQARKRLEQLRERYGLERDNIFLEIGVTKKEIIRVAKAQEADLILVGSHGRHGVELLLGSTANAILHHAPCDVLAIRIKPE